MTPSVAEYRKLLTEMYPPRDQREQVIFSAIIVMGETIEHLQTFIEANIPQAISLLATHVAKLNAGATAAPAAATETAATEEGTDEEDESTPLARSTTTGSSPAAPPPAAPVSTATVPVAAATPMVQTSAPVPIASKGNGGNGARA